jgi:glutathione synthase/RimK-type ligase-like ATP-grasp enzyme
LLLAPLAALGISAEPVAWDDPAADWTGYDLAVLRSPWDYVARLEEFLSWTQRPRRLANPPDVVAWNTDKRYLAELAASGVPIVPTTWLDPTHPWTPPAAGSAEIVIKPVVSSGSQDSGRYDLADAEHRQLASAHVARLQAAGRAVMIQPYLSAVDTAGETALLFLHSPQTGELAYSHAIRKGPLLDGPAEGTEGLYKVEEIAPRTPSEAELTAARQVLAALPYDTRALLYARVDLIPGPDGAPLLIEVELTEPSLFLGTAEGAATRFAKAIAAAAST